MDAILILKSDKSTGKKAIKKLQVWQANSLVIISIFVSHKRTNILLMTFSLPKNDFHAIPKQMTRI